MKIIITGSLGNIGRPLAHRLVQEGHTVIVISSNPDKRDEIASIGAVAAIGKLEDVAFLTATLAGADALFGMVPPNYAAPDHVVYYKTIATCYVEAVKAAGVKRVVHLSSYGAHLPEGTGFITGSYHAEQVLNTLPHVTHLRPGSFFTNLYNFVGMIRHTGVMVANYGGDDLVVMVHPLDIAVAAAEELVRGEGPGVRYVASADVKANEVAEKIGMAIGRPGLQWIRCSDEEAAKAMLERGMADFQVRPLVELGAAIHSGLLRSDYDLHKVEMGKVGVDDFIREFAQAF